MNNIKSIKNINGFPISVIIPLSEHRKDFFYKYTYPSILNNFSAEIIINSNNGTAPEKRNYGFDVSSQPYVFFCDDDIILPSDLLGKFYNILKEQKNDIGYVYCGYKGIVLTNNHPIKGNFEIKSVPFDGERLKRGNYISTMSLIKRDYFPRFDENLERFQDWDLYLTMLNNGIKGKMVKNMDFMAFYMGNGITSNSNDYRIALQKIKKKHNL